MKSITSAFTLLLLALVVTTYGQSSAPFFNEVNYKSTNPAQRGAEVAGEAGTDMTGWSIVTYNANGTKAGERPITGGTIPDIQNGHGSIWYDVEQSSMPSQPGGGLALVDAQGTVVRFISYGSLLLSGIVVRATEGPAAGMTSQYIGTQLLSGSSLQLTGIALDYLGFLWSLPLGSTPGSINTGQLFGLLGLMSTDQQNPQIAETRTFAGSNNEGTLEINLYPNPATDQVQLTLKTALTQTAELLIFDAEGRMVKTATLLPQTINQALDVKDLPAGQYVLHIVEGTNRAAKLFMKH